jgi:hypothetical protein
MSDILNKQSKWKCDVSRRRLYRRYFFLLMVSVAPLPSPKPLLAASPEPTTQPRGDQAEIKFIAVQCDAQLRATPKVSYSFHQEFKSPDYTVTKDGTAIEDHPEGYQQVKITTVQKLAADDGQQTTKTSETAFVGPTCSGFFGTASNLAAQYQHASPLNLTGEERVEMFPRSSPHLERLAFGKGAQSLLQLFEDDEKRPGGSKWEIQAPQKSDSPNTYRLARYAKYKDRFPSKATDLFLIDGSKGFSIVRLDERVPLEPCPLLETHETTVSSFPGGIWYPTAATVTYYGWRPARGSAPENVDLTAQTSLSNITFVKGFDGQEFNMGCLQLPDGTFIYCVSPDGNKKSLKMEAGQIIEKNP